MGALLNPFISFGAGGNTFFVATDGDDGDAGTEAEPWATFDFAVSQLTAGDTLIAAGGTYYESSVEIAADGTSTRPITIQAADGETPILDGSMAAYRASGNSAWENVSGNLYRTVTTVADPGDQGYTGRIDVSGTLYMLTAYVDLDHLQAADDLFDFANPYYMGPGIAYHTDNKIYIRLDPNSAEAQWDLVAPVEISNKDPRTHNIFIAPNNSAFNVTGDYVVIDGIDMRHHWTSVGGTGANVTIKNLTLWPSRFGSRLDANSWTFDTVDIEFHLSPWIARSDVKSGVEPAKGTRTGGISFESTHFHTVNNCTITGAFDAMLALGNNHDLTVTNCLIDNAQDDGCQTGSSAYNIEFGYCTWLGAGPSHDGSGTDSAATPDSVYVHHCVFDNTDLVFWSRKPVPGNDPAENGTEGYHHPAIFSSHSVPDFDDPWKIYNCTIVAWYTPGVQGVNHYAYHGSSAGLGKHEVFNTILNFRFDTRVYRGANANTGLEDFDYIIYAFNGSPSELFAIESVKANGASAATTANFTTWKTDMGWDAHSAMQTTLVPLDSEYQPLVGGPADGTGVDLSAKGWPGTTPGTDYIGAKTPVASVTATAASGLTLSGVATGTKTVTGAAASALTLSATALRPAATTNGTALSALTLSNVATGTRTVKGVALSALTLSGVGTGTRTNVGSTAASALTLAATVVGTPSSPSTYSDDFSSTSGLTMVIGTVSSTGSRLRSTSTAGTGAVAIGSTVTNSANHYSQVVVSTLTSAVSEAGVVLRLNTTGNAHYLGLILPGGGGQAELYYFNGTFYTILTSGSVTIGTLPGTLRGEVDGAGSNNLRLYWRGSLVIQTTHSTLTTGKMGVHLNPSSNVANVELDSWAADTL